MPAGYYITPAQMAPFQSPPNATRRMSIRPPLLGVLLLLLPLLLRWA